jgi:hypothetical protein
VSVVEGVATAVVVELGTAAGEIVLVVVWVRWKREIYQMMLRRRAPTA